MGLKPETIAQLQTMIQADAALLAHLQSCTDVASSAAVIAKAAAAKGMDVSAPDLMTHFEAEAAEHWAMSDAELEQVAGGAGGQPHDAETSISTINIACRKEAPTPPPPNTPGPLG